MNIEFELDEDQINEVLQQVTHEEYLDSITNLHSFEDLVCCIFQELENYEEIIDKHSSEEIQKLKLVKDISLEKLKEL